MPMSERKAPDDDEVYDARRPEPASKIRDGAWAKVLAWDLMEAAVRNLGPHEWVWIAGNTELIRRLANEHQPQARDAR
jgi:hypothetical protein